MYGVLACSCHSSGGIDVPGVHRLSYQTNYYNERALAQTVRVQESRLVLKRQNRRQPTLGLNISFPLAQMVPPALPINRNRAFMLVVFIFTRMHHIMMQAWNPRFNSVVGLLLVFLLRRAPAFPMSAPAASTTICSLSMGIDILSSGGLALFIFGDGMLTQAYMLRGGKMCL